MFLKGLLIKFSCDSIVNLTQDVIKRLFSINMDCIWLATGHFKRSKLASGKTLIGVVPLPSSKTPEHGCWRDC